MHPELLTAFIIDFIFKFKLCCERALFFRRISSVLPPVVANEVEEEEERFTRCGEMMNYDYVTLTDTKQTFFLPLFACSDVAWGVCGRWEETRCKICCVLGSSSAQTHASLVLPTNALDKVAMSSMTLLLNSEKRKFSSQNPHTRLLMAGSRSRCAELKIFKDSE